MALTKLTSSGVDTAQTFTFNSLNVSTTLDVTTSVSANTLTANTFQGKNINISLAGDSTTMTLDLSTANIFTANLTANVTDVTVSNPPTSGTPTMFLLKLTYGDSTTRTVTWGSEFEWPDGTAPTLTCTTGTADMFTFYTDNGAANVYSFTAGQKLY